MTDISYRTRSSEYKKFFRTLGKQSDRWAYEENTQRQFNCHIGQRKLFFTELEFLTLLCKEYDPKDVLVVYAGAAPGHHFPLILRMFPKLSWVLIDPAPFVFTESLSDSIRIINDFYTDDTHLRITREMNPGKKHIAFISDIRVAPTNKQTFNDMLSQQRWTINLQPVAYMLKCRFPYPDEEFSYETFQWDPSEYRGLVDIPPRQTNKLLYLSGRMYLQLYAPSRSTETRLIRILRTGQRLRFAWYDVHQYDEQLNHFNMIDRSLSYSFKGSKTMKAHLLGYDDSYESVGEYFLIWKYIKHCLGQKVSNESVIRMLYMTDKGIRLYSRGSVYTCMIRALTQRLTKEEKDIQQVRSNYKALVLSTIRSLTNQKKAIQVACEQGGILNSKQYMEQLRKIQTLLKELRDE